MSTNHLPKVEEVVGAGTQKPEWKGRMHCGICGYSHRVDLDTKDPHLNCKACGSKNCQHRVEG